MNKGWHTRAEKCEKLSRVSVLAVVVRCELNDARPRCKLVVTMERQERSCRLGTDRKVVKRKGKMKEEWIGGSLRLNRQEAAARRCERRRSRERATQLQRTKVNF